MLTIKVMIYRSIGDKSKFAKIIKKKRGERIGKLHIIELFRFIVLIRSLMYDGYGFNYLNFFVRASSNKVWVLGYEAIKASTRIDTNKMSVAVSLIRAKGIPI